MIKKMGKVFINIQMVVIIKAILKMDSEMEKVYFIMIKNNKFKEYGLMEN